jgi:hypothetical protein
MANTSLSECDPARRKKHMNMKHLLATSICAGFVFIGLHTEERVNVEGLSVRIVRAPNDGLNDLAVSEVCAGPSVALAGCAIWDIKENCCPAGCAAKKGTNWSKADEILQGCMRGLGCSDSDTKGATVNMKCDCK